MQFFYHGLYGIVSQWEKAIFDLRYSFETPRPIFMKLQIHNHVQDTTPCKISRG